MQYFRQVFNFYINSSIHVSFAVVALAVVTSYALNISVEVSLLAFLFFSTVTGYNFVKYAEIAGLHHRSLAQSLKKVQIFSVICGFGMLSTMWLLRWEVLVTVGLFGVLTVLYAIPLRGLFEGAQEGYYKNLRKIRGLKIYIIALVWAGVTVVLPVLQDGLEMYCDVWVVCVQRFLFVLALMIPFEIRDLSYDAQSLKTLPQVVGIQKTKVVGMTWLLGFVCLGFLRDAFIWQSVVTDLLIALLVGGCILFSRKQQSRYFASFWVEGIALVWLCLVVFF